MGHINQGDIVILYQDKELNKTWTYIAKDLEIRINSMSLEMWVTPTDPKAPELSDDVDDSLLDYFYIPDKKTREKIVYLMEASSYTGKLSCFPDFPGAENWKMLLGKYVNPLYKPQAWAKDQVVRAALEEELKAAQLW